MSQLQSTLNSIATRFGTRALNLIAFIVLARALSQEDFGYYGVILSLSFIFVAVFDFGIRNSIAYHVGKDPRSGSVHLTNIIILFPLFSVCATIAFVVIMKLQLEEIFFSEYILPIFVLIPGMLFTRTFQGYLIGIGNLQKLNVSELMGRLVFFSIVMFEHNYDSISLSSGLWALSISYVVSSLIIAPKMIFEFKFSKLSFSAYIMLVNRGGQFLVGVVLLLIANRIPYFLLPSLGTMTEIGIFFGLQRLAEICTEFVLAVSLVLFSYNVRTGDECSNALRSAYTVRLTLLILALPCLLLIIFGGELVAAVLGENFRGFGALFAVLALGSWFSIIWVVVQPSIGTFLQPILSAAIFGPIIVLSILLFITGYKLFGILGAGVGFMLTNLITSLAFMLVLYWKRGVHPSDFICFRKSDFVEIFLVVFYVIKRGKK